MSLAFKVLRSTLFSVAATLAALACSMKLSGIGVPAIYWLFAILCSGTLGTAIAGRLELQAEAMCVLHAQLQQAHAQLQQAAEQDSLTGVFNRGAFFQKVERHRHDDSSGWLLLLDIDHFKAINDRHGHGVGDETLRALADLLRRVTRAQDMVARIGGEEFALYLPGLQESEALAVAERIRRTIAEHLGVSADGCALTVTASIGLARDDATQTLENSLHLADLAMYRAKHEGRNRVARAA